MSPTYISAIAIILVSVLKAVGVEVGSEELTSTITTIVAIVGGLIIAYRRKTSTTQSEINILGVVK